MCSGQKREPRRAQASSEHGWVENNHTLHRPLGGGEHAAGPHTLGGRNNKMGPRSGAAQSKRPFARMPIRAGVPVGTLLARLPNAPTTGSWLGGSSGARFGRFFMMGWLMESAVSG